MLTRNEIDRDNPRSLFKYSRFDHYALSNLINRAIWLADPQSFNDPFDTLFLFDESFTDVELATHLNDCAASRGEPTNYTPETARKHRPMMLECLAEVRTRIAACGITSLSATPFEILEAIPKPL